MTLDRFYKTQNELEDDRYLLAFLLSELQDRLSRARVVEKGSPALQCFAILPTAW